jgi:hypothetical protein
VIPPVLEPGRTRRRSPYLKPLLNALLAAALATLLVAPLVFATDTHPLVCGGLWLLDYVLVRVALSFPETGFRR